MNEPYTRPSAIYCPDCGNLLAIVTRRSERAEHCSPLVYSCVPCKRSWSIPAQPVIAAGVDFDSGIR